MGVLGGRVRSGFYLHGNMKGKVSSENETSCVCVCVCVCVCNPVGSMCDCFHVNSQTGG